MSENVALKTEAIDIDFPRWMTDELEQKAAKFGVTPQELVKIWIAERLERV